MSENLAVFSEWKKYSVFCRGVAASGSCVLTPPGITAPLLGSSSDNGRSRHTELEADLRLDPNPAAVRTRRFRTALA